MLRHSILAEKAGTGQKKAPRDQPSEEAKLKKRVIAAEDVPPALGPYSHGIAFGDFVFTCGQLGKRAQTGELAKRIEAQAKQALENLKAVLNAAGTSLENVVKVTVYLNSMSDFATMNSVYAEYFPRDPPARTTLETHFSRPELKMEIEAIAGLP